MQSENGMGQESFSDFHRQHAPGLYKFVYRLLGSGDDARDVTQESFIRLFQNLDRGIEHPKSWVFRVAANLCRDQLRQGRNRARLQQAFTPADEGDAGAEAETIRREEAANLRRVLERMKPRDRILLALYLQGLSFREIADAGGIRRSSVGKVLSRALERLGSEIRKGVKA